MFPFPSVSRAAPVLSAKTLDSRLFSLANAPRYRLHPCRFYSQQSPSPGFGPALIQSLRQTTKMAWTTITGQKSTLVTLFMAMLVGSLALDLRKERKDLEQERMIYMSKKSILLQEIQELEDVLEGKTAPPATGTASRTGADAVQSDRTAAVGALPPAGLGQRSASKESLSSVSQTEPTRASSDEKFY
ncbi:hypothetical protein HDV03_002953 [Kappamyces sp. JEL0829]|nr:hypothetical protein HDV03_002953 [Kappamyces sp. JEL0829]